MDKTTYEYVTYDFSEREFRHLLGITESRLLKLDVVMSTDGRVIRVTVAD